MSGRERSTNDSNSNSSSSCGSRSSDSDSDHRESVEARARADERGAIATDCRDRADRRPLEQDGQQHQQERRKHVYTAAAALPVAPVTGAIFIPAVGCPVLAVTRSEAAGGVRPSEWSASMVSASASESSDDSNAGHARRRRRGRGKQPRVPVGAPHPCPALPATDSDTEPAAKPLASEAELLAASSSSGLSKNRKRKLKKRRRLEARRNLTAEPDARSATGAKEFFYDDTAEVNEKRQLEEEKKAHVIAEIQDFVSAIADLHACENHVSWSSTLDSLAKQMAVLDRAALGSLRLIKTLLVLNDKERAHDAMSAHLVNAPLSPDVKDMLIVLFNYWLTSVMT